jgi:hypothetical protein
VSLLFLSFFLFLFLLLLLLLFLLFLFSLSVLSFPFSFFFSFLLILLILLILFEYVLSLSLLLFLSSLSLCSLHSSPTLSRKLIKTPDFEKFMFAVENTRLHDVLLTLEAVGQNVKMLPAGEATGFGYRKVEGVVPMGAQLVFATVEPMNPNEKLQFSVNMGVDRIDVEVRCSELEGVFQNIHIRHGKVVEFSFEVCA